MRTRIVATGFGNVSRDLNRALREVDFDASVSKDFKIHEALNLQFCADAFNVSSHTNFQAPNGSLTGTPLFQAPTAATFLGLWEDYGDATKSPDAAIRAVFLLTFVLR